MTGVGGEEGGGREQGKKGGWGGRKGGWTLIDMPCLGQPSLESAHGKHS